MASPTRAPARTGGPRAVRLVASRPLYGLVAGSLAAIFVAQSAGVHMSIGQQLLLVFTLMLTSKGVAGVPRAALVILLGTVAQFNLPVEPVFIILGIDELMDMARTSLNVLGNSFATVVIAKWEGEFGKEHPSRIVREAIEP